MRLTKRHYLWPSPLPHSRFCTIWFYCIMFYRYHKFYKVLYRDFLFYAAYGFLKGKMIPLESIHSNLQLCFWVPKVWWSQLYKISSVPWMNYLSNRRLVKVTSHSVCETRKIKEFPALLLVKFFLFQVEALKQI